MDFRKHMALLLVLLSIVPFIILQINAHFFYVPTITARIKALFTYNLQQKNENLQRLLSERVNTIAQLVNDRSLTAIIRDLNDSPVPTTYQRSRLVDVFSGYTVINDAMAGIGFIRKDGLVVEYDRFGLQPEISSFKAYGSLAAVLKSVDDHGTQTSFPTKTYKNGPGPLYNILLTVFPYFDIGTNSHEGYMFLLLNEAAFQRVVNPAVVDDSQIVARTVLYDSKGNLISFPGSYEFGTPIAALGDGGGTASDIARIIPELRGKSVDWISEPVPKTDWTLSTVYDEQSLFNDRNVITLYTLLIGLIFLISAAIIIYAVSRRLLRSFSALVQQVRIQDNRLNLADRSEKRDDMEYLGGAFTRMQDHIVGLVTEVNERNASMLALSEKQRLSEIRALEAQVNPHFMYNTLNTLNWIAIRNDQHELSKGLSDLADIMQYSISQIEITATIEDEIRWLRKYLDLQQLRFKNNFSYAIRHEGVAPNFRIYKLLFQPIIENSLVHGFEPNTPGGLLEISMEMCEGKRLRAVIKDNGRGFDVSTRHPDSIGISNLERRLEVYYGKAATFFWESSVGRGTTATLEVPEVLS